jgi:hypothetical protein
LTLYTNAHPLTKSQTKNSPTTTNSSAKSAVTIVSLVSVARRSAKASLTNAHQSIMTAIATTLSTNTQGKERFLGVGARHIRIWGAYIASHYTHVTFQWEWNGNMHRKALMDRRGNVASSSHMRQTKAMLVIAIPQDIHIDKARPCPGELSTLCTSRAGTINKRWLAG